MGFGLQIAKKGLKGLVAGPGRFLLHPVTRARNEGGPAEIRAAGAGIGIEIHARDKVPYRVALTADKAAGLLQKSPVLRRKLLRIEALSPIAIQRPPKPPGAKGAGVHGKILAAHPRGEGFRARKGL